MTKEELKQEAEEYTNTHGTLVMGCEENLDCTKFMQEAYLASAEPREKRIAELEELHKGMSEAYNEERERTFILEKENAELKETLKTYNGCGDWDNDFHTCRVYLQHEELQMYIHQLTKAKEIIKELVRAVESSYSVLSWQRPPIKAEAEDFLKESE